MGGCHSDHQRHAPHHDGLFLAAAFTWRESSNKNSSLPNAGTTSETFRCAQNATSSGRPSPTTFRPAADCEKIASVSGSLRYNRSAPPAPSVISDDPERRSESTRYPAQYASSTPNPPSRPAPTTATSTP